MEEEIDIRRNIRDHYEREKSLQNDGDNNEQQERRNIDNNRRRCVRRRLFSDDSDNDPQERENINNRLLEERRIQLEEVRDKSVFLNVKIMPRHELYPGKTILREILRTLDTDWHGLKLKLLVA